MLIKKIVVICIFALFGLQANASVLTNYLSNLHTFQGDFVQSIFTSNNTVKQKSKGLIIVKSPNKFFLEYNEPYKLVYIADGKKLWSYDEDLEQVVVKEQGNILINTPAMLLGNPQDLTKSYKIEELGETNGWLWFELTPKNDNSNFESVGLAFKNNELKAMEMRDSFGQTTRLEFVAITKNPTLKNNRFKFVPPKGVDIIGQ